METYSILLTKRDALTATPQVFLCPDNDAWRAPAFLPDDEIHNTNVGAANRFAQDSLSVSVVTRQAIRLIEPTLRGPLNIYFMEISDDNVGRSPTVAGKWFGREGFANLALTLSQERAALTAFFAETNGEKIPDLGLVWWREGGFAAASAWLRTRVGELGGEILGPVEQIRNAYTSTILRILTDEGYWYLKIVPAAFSHEITVTQKLAEQDNEHFPSILMRAPDRMILRDLGDQHPPAGHTALIRWEQIIRYYGELQTSSVRAIPQWLAMGCADLRLSRLASQTEELIERLPVRLHGLPQRLSEEEMARLSQKGSLLQTLCKELTDYGIPDALEHGDLHSGNVALYETGFRLYDWSHSCVTFPFYGFGSLLLDDDWFPGRPEALTHLQDAYLEAWTQYAPMPRLRKAFSLWKRLRPFFVAAHQSHIVATYQEMMGGLDYIPATATGNTLQYMQWWLANHWRNTLQSLDTQ